MRFCVSVLAFGQPHVDAAPTNDLLITSQCHRQGKQESLGETRQTDGANRGACVHKTATARLGRSRRAHPSTGLNKPNSTWPAAMCCHVDHDGINPQYPAPPAGQRPLEMSRYPRASLTRTEQPWNKLCRPSAKYQKKLRGGLARSVGHGTVCVVCTRQDGGFLLIRVLVTQRRVPSSTYYIVYLPK